MKADEFDQLVNSVLDGSASDDERASLERRLHAEPAARAQLASWERLFETLRATPRPEPPAEIRHRILAAVRRESAPATSWRSAWEAFIGRRPAVALAYATAFGVVAGSVISLTASGVLSPGAPTAPVSGTMSRPGPADVPAAEWSSLPASGVAFRTWREGDVLHFEGRADGVEPFELELAFDPAALRVAAILTPDHPASRAAFEPGRVRISGSGKSQVEVRWAVLQPAAAPIQVTARSGASEERATIAVTPEVQGSRGP